MKVTVFESNGHSVAEVKGDDQLIRTLQDAFDLMATAYYGGATYVFIRKHQLMPAFFDLSTGVAGELLQKYSNYQMKLVIIGDFSAFSSESLQAFIRESNRGSQVAFVTDREAALDLLN